MDTIPKKIIRQLLILIGLAIVAFLIFRELLPYLSGVLGAVTLYVLLKGSMAKLVKKGWNENLAVSFLMFISFIGILLPIIGIAMMMANKVQNAVHNSEKFMNAIQSHIQSLEEKIGYDFYKELDVSAATSWVSENAQVLIGNTFNLFIAISIMYFMLYFMLTKPKQLRAGIYDYVPFNKKHLKILIHDSAKMVRSNALGIPIVAVAQGIIALIGFLIFGIENPLFWFVIVIIGSMIPFVGTLVGILPVFLIALASGDSFAAWGILLYGFIVVGSTDNIIRLYVLKKMDDVHPLITLIGVIIGIPLFGFIGLIFGPIFISLFFIVAKMYKMEYVDPNEKD
ncbi:MAG: AI-2E family transporter [Flavobacteriaceae bacterium]|nr:AI-2E family transporter [Flavobacteriaceae bacterium]